MPLAPGTRLGPYEVQALLGAGGMGEVYKATDTRLNRTVALKVLPPDLSTDLDRRARFEREARAISALNHPHICTLHDVGQQDGIDYLVMEHLEGETLADRLQRGPLPLDQVLRYGAETAGALDKAHRSGIVHRDLKPGNVMLTKSGVKLLDFGLARLRNDEGSEPSELSSLPTQGKPLTKEGTLLGTLQYMAPEQLEGKEVDLRTDIWALGLLLYEMTTGQRAFSGKSRASLIAAILDHEPQPMGELRPLTPASLDRLVRQCLAKDAEDRWQSAHDLKRELEWISETGSQTVTPPARPRRLTRSTWVTGLVVVLLGGALALWLPRRQRPPTNEPLLRLDVDLGAEINANPVIGNAVIISPDGNRIVYLSENRLFTRRLDQRDRAELKGTDGATAPFFSPDGKWIGFFAQGKLKKISVEGGAAVPLTETGVPSAVGGGSWGEDGSILANLQGPGPLVRIDSGGGEGRKPEAVTQLREGETVHVSPQILPGGRAVLFTAMKGLGNLATATLEVQSLVDGTRKTLHRGSYFGRYVGTSERGYLLYLNQTTLFAEEFDSGRLETDGNVAPLLEDVQLGFLRGNAQFDISSSGTAVYRVGGIEGSQLVIEWLDRTGGRQTLLSKPGLYQRPRLSPDGQHLAVTRNEQGLSILSYDVKHDTLSSLTFGGDSYNGAVWSPNGRYVVFANANDSLLWIRADGRGSPQPLVVSGKRMFPYSFTPDGKRLAFMQLGSTGYDIYTVSVEEDRGSLRAGEPEAFLVSSWEERHPYFSPDGKWIAYSSAESGVFQVNVRAFPDTGGKWQISDEGGVYPIWPREGDEIFFRTEDNHIMSAKYHVKGETFEHEKAGLWTPTAIADISFIANFDVSANGQRVLALMETEQFSLTRRTVTFLFHFDDEIRRRVAAANAK